METEKMIDVVEEFVCPNQSEAYRKAYQDWRRKPENRYAFAFTKHPKEAAFSDNKAILKNTPSNVEQAVLHRLGTLLGYALIVYLLIENVLDKLIVFVLQKMGFRIDFVFLEYAMLGNEQIVFMVSTLITVLKYLVPLLILTYALRMPVKVSLPLQIRHPQEMIAGAALTMLLSAGLGMFCVSSSSELKKYQVISDSMGTENEQLVLYELFVIFAIPIIMELLLHGCMFQVLRQFGDAFAVGTITVISMLLMHTPQDMIRIGIITLTISYFVIQTGSFLAAPILHIIHEIYMFALYYIECFGSAYSMQWWLIVLLPCLIGVMAAGYMFLLHKQRVRNPLTNEGTYLKWPEKTSALFSAMPMLGLTITCILLMVVVSVII